jgi:hypothetical protein
MISIMRKARVTVLSWDILKAGPLQNESLKQGVGTIRWAYLTPSLRNIIGILMCLP